MSPVAIVIVLVMTILNRVRGGGFDAQALPGHPRYWVTPVVGLFAYLWSGSLMHGAIFAGCFLVWSLVPWGHCIGLGRWSPAREPAYLELHALEAAGGSPYLALFILEAIGLFPAILLVSFAGLFMLVLMVPCYELGWRLRPKAPIELAELLVGALWGGLMVVS
jgi:hypothetical protein